VAKPKCTKIWNEDDLHQKTTSNGRRPQIEDNLKCKMTSNGRWPPIVNDLQLKMTSNGRGPLIEDYLQWKTTSRGRRPPMEDDLQWFKYSSKPRLMFHRGNSEQILEEISSVALLSPACYTHVVEQNTSLANSFFKQVISWERLVFRSLEMTLNGRWQKKCAEGLVLW
jgi:hypothetical protein